MWLIPFNCRIMFHKIYIFFTISCIINSPLFTFLLCTILVLLNNVARLLYYLIYFKFDDTSTTTYGCFLYNMHDYSLHRMLPGRSSFWYTVILKEQLLVTDQNIANAPSNEKVQRNISRSHRNWSVHCILII